MSENILGHQGLLSLSRSTERYVTKKEWAKKLTLWPRTASKRHYDWLDDLASFGNAKAVWFKEEMKLNERYRRDLEVTYMDQLFKNITKVGEGSFGMVYRAMLKEDSKFYAIKTFKRNRNTLISSYKEVQNCEKVGNNEYCVRFIQAWEEQKQLYMMMEYCDTNLAKYSLAHHSFTELQVWNILVDVLSGLQHLHGKNLIHLDIKPDNILVSHNGVCKLGDFGLLVDLTELKRGDKLDRRAINYSEGDAKYLAPEVLQQKIYTKACDIFSVGITILELVTDVLLPGNGVLWHQLRMLTFPDVFYKNVPMDLQILIQKMMNHKYEERPSADSLLCHSVLKKILTDRKNVPREDYLGINCFTEENICIPTIIEPKTPPSVRKERSFEFHTPNLGSSDNCMVMKTPKASIYSHNVAKKLFSC